MPRILIAALAGAGLIVGWLAGGGLEEVEAQAQTYGNSQAQTHSQGADIGRYRMIMQSGVWLLDTATGDTWQWKCPPGEQHGLDPHGPDAVRRKLRLADQAAQLLGWEAN